MTTSTPNESTHISEVENANTVVIASDGEGENVDARPNSSNATKKFKTQKKLTSAVWNDFKKEMQGGKCVAICNHCKNLTGESSSGTSHLKKHLLRCTKRKNQDVRQRILKNGERKKDGTIVLENFKYDQDKSRLALARMFILHEYPFNMIKHVGFRLFVRSLQPQFRFMSRQTITSDCMKLYECEKLKMYAELDDFRGKISITSDLWTSNQNMGYMALTAHYIDGDWMLQKKILNFLKVDVPHNAERLGDTMLSCLMEWNIDGKLFTMTLDNCSVNNKMAAKVVDKLNENHFLMFNGQFIHIRCASHVLNLIVQEGLKSIEGVLDNIRKSVKYFYKLPKKESAFRNAAKQAHISSEKQLFLDCPTRWNSTYLMLEVAIIYKDAFSRLQARDKKYKFVPSDKDWENAIGVANCLKTFYDATLTFSGVQYPTSNLYFEEVCEIHINLKTWCTHDDFIGTMAENMKTKFDQYWSECHVLLALAAVLDPSSKMQLVECYYRDIYSEDVAVSKTAIVRDQFQVIYQEYAVHFSIENPQCVPSEVKTTSNADGPMIKRQKRFDKFLSQVSTVQIAKSELDYYLEEPILPRTSDEFDILGWWKVHERKFPILAMMARDILTIPVSTVASESAFSTGSRVVSKYRSRLGPDVVQGLICTQSWIKNEYANYEAYEDESSSSEDEFEQE